MSRRTRRLALVTLVAFALLLVVGFLAARGGVRRVSFARMQRAAVLNPLFTVTQAEALFGGPGLLVAFAVDPDDASRRTVVVGGEPTELSVAAADAEGPNAVHRVWPGYGCCYMVSWRDGVPYSTAAITESRFAHATWLQRQLERFDR